MNYYVRGENVATSTMSEDLGPFSDYMQITYGELRSGPDGDTIIASRNKDGLWELPEAEGLFSDLVMWAE